MDGHCDDKSSATNSGNIKRFTPHSPVLTPLRSDQFFRNMNLAEPHLSQ